MPASITEVSLLKTYLSGVMVRADHHADSINEVVLSLTGAIIWRKDSDPIEVMIRDGDLKNVLWVRISGIRFAFSYSHESGEIEMRQGSTQGALVHSFSNNITASQVRAIFSAL